MPRNGEDARRRLLEATLELFEQQGFDATTAAAIAARAGVTERTFFRHFPDKREALFDGEAAFRQTLAEAVAGASAQLEPLDALVAAFRSVVPILERNRPITERRQRIIDRTPALQERVSSKTAGLVEGVALGLRRRGVDPATASLAAQIGMAAFADATLAWLSDAGPGLYRRLDDTVARLRHLTSRRETERRGGQTAP